jgi:ribonuclease D
MEVAQNIFYEKKRDATASIKDEVNEYNGFQLVSGDDGEIFTDLELLDKLKQERLNMAKRLGVPVDIIYRNKQLVALATFKPLNKKEYSSLRWFSEKSWDEFGSIMVEIIKERVNSGK